MEVPWQKSAQLALGEFKVPDIHAKYHLLVCAHNILLDLDYYHIGMGHYLRNGSKAFEAYKSKSLVRNIMGLAKAPKGMQLALGVSGISVANKYRWQNQRVLDRYLHINGPWTKGEVL